MKRIAIIPARGGSKRIPRKNIKLFMGKPIIAYSIEVALKSELFEEVMVSTDDEEIAEVARGYGAQVPFLRSEKISSDYATTADVICEVLENYKTRGIDFDIVTCIYATAPFLSCDKLRQGMDMIKNGSYDVVFTMVPYSYPIQRTLIIRDEKVCMKWPEYKNTRSQDLETAFHDAGQFYISTKQAWDLQKSFWGENTGAIILDELEVQDLDTVTDWALAEMKYRTLQENETNLI